MLKNVNFFLPLVKMKMNKNFKEILDSEFKDQCFRLDNYSINNTLPIIKIVMLQFVTIRVFHTYHQRLVLKLSH